MTVISSVTTGENVLERELATFARLLPSLLDVAQGRWVLVKNDQLLGLFASQRDAIDAGYAQMGNQPFLTREILEPQMAASFGHDFLIGALGID